MKKKPILTLPLVSAEVSEPVVVRDSRGLCLELDVRRENQTTKVVVNFVKPRAYRQRAESHCTVWHVEDVYGVVCEIENSNWVKELRSETQEEWRNFFTLRHFMIYIDDFGCMEVIAEAVSLNEDNLGSSVGT